MILEWRPFHRIVTRDRLPYFGGVLQVFSVTELEPTEAGTVVTISVGGMTGPALRRSAARIALKAGRKGILAGGEAFRSRVEADHASRMTAAATV